MKTSDVIESAIWMTGDEPQQILKRFKQDVRAAVGILCHEKGFTHGPVTFIEKHPMDDRVPEVPPHIQGQKVRLLVGESTVTGKLVVSPKGSFIADLDKKDLDLLRKITRKAYSKTYGTLIGNPKCDEIIEALGVDAALETLH